MKPMSLVQLDEGDVGRLGVTNRDVGKWAVISCGVIVRKFSGMCDAQKFMKEVRNHGK